MLETQYSSFFPHTFYMLQYVLSKISNWEVEFPNYVNH